MYLLHFFFHILFSYLVIEIDNQSCYSEGSSYCAAATSQMCIFQLILNILIFFFCIYMYCQKPVLQGSCRKYTVMTEALFVYVFINKSYNSKCK